MKDQHVPTSYQVIQLVKAAISNQYLTASDTSAAKALGISRAAVSGYKSGKDVMGLETLSRAQEIMQLNGVQLAELSINLSIESTKHEGARKVLHAVRDAIRGTAPSILLISSALFGAFQSPAGSTGSAANLENTSFDRDMYYTCCALRHWRRLVKRWFATWLPAIEPASVLAGA